MFSLLSWLSSFLFTTLWTSLAPTKKHTSPKFKKNVHLILFPLTFTVFFFFRLLFFIVVSSTASVVVGGVGVVVTTIGGDVLAVVVVGRESLDSLKNDDNLSCLINMNLT